MFANKLFLRFMQDDVCYGAVRLFYFVMYGVCVCPVKEYDPLLIDI